MSSPLPPNGEPTDRQKIWCGNYEDGVPARLEQATRTIVDVFDSSVCVSGLPKMLSNFSAKLPPLQN